MSPKWTNIESARAFEPTSVLIVKLISAECLAKKGGLLSLIGESSPDSYAKIQLGSIVYKTEVVNNSKNPVWPENEYAFLLDTVKGKVIESLGMILIAFDIKEISI